MTENHQQPNTAFLPTRPTVVIIGGGFAGIEAARHLSSADANILLIDKRNYHLFQPLLYQVATSVLTPADIAFPLRRMFSRQKNVTNVLGEVSELDPHNQTIKVGHKDISWDYVVLAAGALTNYYGRDDWNTASTGLKSLDDATQIRAEILASFERAEATKDPEVRARELTFVVVGGGATGVELSGAIRELAVDSLCTDLNFVETVHTRVVLIDTGEQLLAGFDKKLQDYSKNILEERGVEVMLKSQVVDVTDDGVTIQATHDPSSEIHIHTRNIIWAAGVNGNPLGNMLGKAIGIPPRNDGRLAVEPDLTIHDFPNIYVVGDLAAATNSRHGGEVPGVAAAAIQMGTYAGRAITHRLSGKAKTSIRGFRYRDKGSMATIGRARAVAQTSSLKLTGLIAWLAWGALHILYLVGLRNRIFTILNWLITYCSYRKGSRLITDSMPIESHIPPDLLAQEESEDATHTERMSTET